MSWRTLWFCKELKLLIVGNAYDGHVKIERIYDNEVQ
jgi:hypothetical protein